MLYGQRWATVLLLAFAVCGAYGADEADDFKILSATYSAGEKKVDVTKDLAAMVADGALTVTATDDLAGGDMPPGERLLLIVYQYGGKSRVGKAALNETVTLPEQDLTVPAGRSFVMFTEVKGPILSEAHAKAMRSARIETANRRARALVVEVNTPGGRVNLTQKIVEEIRQAEDFPTIAWVKGQGAISAGVWVALACDKVVISPGAVMGASMPYHVTDGLTDVVEEKFLSTLRSQYAAAARMHGRPGALAEAMVDPGLEVWEVRRDGRLHYVRADQAGDADRRNKVSTISAPGKLLSVTAAEAVRLGLADAIVRDDDVVTAAATVADLGQDPLIYRKSLLAEKAYARETAAEERARLEAERRRAELEKRWRAEWERLREAEAELIAMDPRRYPYIFEGEDRRFKDGGKAWRERSEKCIEEANKCIESLENLIELVEPLAGEDQDARRALFEMRRYLQRLRVRRTRLEELKDRKGIAD